MARLAHTLSFVLCGGLAACGYPPLDPVATAGQDAGSTGADGSTATVADHLVFSTGNVTLAQGQQARLHVQLVHEDGTKTDVTAGATYRSDNAAIVAISDAAVVTGADQAGDAVVTASFAGVAQAKLTVTVTSVTCHPVINELVTGTSMGAGDEFVELYNPCVSAIDVDGWTLDYRASNSISGNPDSALLVTLTGNLAAGGYLLAAGSEYAGAADLTWAGATGLLSQVSGAVGLRSGAMTTGALVDSVGYGIVTADNPFVEQTAIAPMSNGLSASRLPFDGNDNNNNSEDIQIVATPTPGKPNAP